MDNLPVNREKAELAIARLRDVEYMKSTAGWAILQELKEQAEQLEFTTSISKAFSDRVMENPAIYAQHTGFVNGLRFFEEKFTDIERVAKKAVSDLEKLESFEKHKQSREYVEPQ